MEERQDTISRQAAIDVVNRAVTKEAARLSIQELPFARPEQRWIPVTERLPDIAEVVLGCSRSGEIDTVWRTSFSVPCGKWDTNGLIIPEDVIAWMPLPEPYREEER